MGEDLYLARADLQASNFSFEAFSDQCKKVDFVTHSAIGYDARYEGGWGWVGVGGAELEWV